MDSDAIPSINFFTGPLRGIFSRLLSILKDPVQAFGNARRIQNIPRKGSTKDLVKPFGDADLCKGPCKHFENPGNLWHNWSSH